MVLDDQRPRLDGAGTAPAAVAATLGCQAVTLDGAGRVTSLRGTTFTWSYAGPLLGATDPIPAAPESYEVDAFRRRVKRTVGSDLEFYVYEGANRTAVLDSTGAVRETYLFAGVDDPLRFRRDTTTAYYETDLAGNVRRLRGPGGADLGGYRYTAFGKAYAAEPGTPAALVEQPLRWKTRWFSQVAGGVYDVRPRQWSPELGAFLSADEYAFHDRYSTLWSWPGQNPARWRDPFGRGTGAENDRSAFDQFVFDLDENGALDATAGFGTGLLDNAPVNPFLPGVGPTYGDVVAAAGLSGRHPTGSGGPCAGGGGDDNGDIAGKARTAGMITGAVALGAKGVAEARAANAARFSPNQAALIKLAKEAKQAGGISQAEAQTLLDWAKEYGLSARGPEAHPGRPFGQFPHIHIGPIDRIPVNP